LIQRPRGTKLRPDELIATTLEIVQAHRVVPIYRALDAAIAALSRQGRRRRLA